MGNCHTNQRYAVQPIEQGQLYESTVSRSEAEIQGLNSYSNWKPPTLAQAPPAVQIENEYFTHSSWRLPTLAEAPPAIQIEAQYKSPPQYLVGHRDNKRA